jgi:hypothetical protein
MNNSCFSFTRFNLVARKYFAEEARTNILRLVLLLGMMTIVFSIPSIVSALQKSAYIEQSKTLNPNDPNNANNLTFFKMEISEMQTHAKNHDNGVDYIASEKGIACLFAFFFAAYFASNVMDHTKHKPGRIAVLTLPATSLEKFFVRWLTLLVLFIPAFCIVFALSDLLRTAMLSIFFPALPDVYPCNYSQLFHDLFSHWGVNNNSFLSSFLFVQSLFFLGGTIWHGNAFIKNCAAFTVLLLTSILIFVCAAGIHEKMLVHPIGAKEFLEDFYYFFYPLTVVLWAVSFQRFRETDVVHKLF